MEGVSFINNNALAAIFLMESPELLLDSLSVEGVSTIAIVSEAREFIQEVVLEICDAPLNRTILIYEQTLSQTPPHASFCPFACHTLKQLFSMCM